MSLSERIAQLLHLARTRNQSVALFPPPASTHILLYSLQMQPHALDQHPITHLLLILLAHLNCLRRKQKDFSLSIEPKWRSTVRLLSSRRLPLPTSFGKSDP